MSDREKLYDELQTERNHRDYWKAEAEKRQATIEELLQDLALAGMRIEELEAALDSATERSDEPYV